MPKKFELLIHFIVTLIKLSKPGGVKVVMAETQAMKQQLIVMNRGKRRAPKLTSFDRFFFGFLAFFVRENRISMQIYEAFGIEISRFAIGRILRQNWHKFPPGDGPSWLTFIGHMKDSIWSVDLFHCESILLKSHWIMVIIDQYSRRIIGFAVHAGDCDGVAYCQMFNRIISGESLPKYLSSDNDPLFRFHRWQANLRVIDVEEIKSVPGVPTSHPFVERVIGTCRREFLDHQLFWNESDLQRKLEYFQKYYNKTRAHSSLELMTPGRKADSSSLTDRKVVSLENYRWKSRCRGLYQLPVAA